MRYVAKMYLTARNFFAKKEEGASMVEYGLLVSLIAVVCIVSVALIGTNLNTMFNAVAGRIDTTP